jgi:hypothetical protein
MKKKATKHQDTVTKVHDMATVDPGVLATSNGSSSFVRSELALEPSVRVFLFGFECHVS